MEHLVASLDITYICDMSYFSSLCPAFDTFPEAERQILYIDQPNKLARRINDSMQYGDPGFREL